MKAYNWQLKREINYPYEVKRPKRQFAVVMDLNKCIACQTCTVACKTTWTPGRGQEYMLWNNVETKPYGFYPLGWDVRLLELLEGNKKTVFDAPEVTLRGCFVLGSFSGDTKTFLACLHSVFKRASSLLTL